MALVRCRYHRPAAAAASVLAIDVIGHRRWMLAAFRTGTDSVRDPMSAAPQPSTSPDSRCDRRSVWRASARPEMSTCRATLIGRPAGRPNRDRVVHYSCAPTTPTPYCGCRTHRHALRSGGAVMRRPNPRTAIIDADGETPRAGSMHTQASSGLGAPDEFEGSGEFPETCFEHCSPIRTRCPGPAAQMSVNNDGHWMPICRRNVS